MEPSPSKPRDHDATLARRRSSKSIPVTNSTTTTATSDPASARHKYDSPFDASLAIARKRSQQEKLWEMFATYALQMSSEDPTRMRVQNVIRLLQDCGVIDGSNSEEAKMIEKEVKIVCDSFLKLNPSDRDNTKRMDFTAFLGLLMHFAQMSGDQDPTRAYDSLVRTCLEKQQKPRLRTPVAKELQESKKVMQAFDEPLTKLFSYFAGITHAKLEKLDRKMAQLSPPHMGYAECLTFARKYGVIAHGVLTTTEFATLYIDSLTKSPVYEFERVLRFDGFCELLVRVSRRACAGDHLSADKKLKGLFQLMWLASSSTSPRALKITDVLKTDKVDVTKLFQLHFEKFWKRENYENYVGDRVGTIASSSSLSSSPFSTVSQALYEDIAGMSMSDMSSTSPPLSSSSGVISPPGAPVSPLRRGMTRRLSLCVQTTAVTESGQPKTLQRRFSIQQPTAS